MPGMTPEFLILGLIWYIVFLFSTTCHEGAHALIARLGGDPTAFHGGQVSLNPLPHIKREPVGLVIVPILSYLIAHWMIGLARHTIQPGSSAILVARLGWLWVARRQISHWSFCPLSQSAPESILGFLESRTQ
jgi:hypothetical protein